MACHIGDQAEMISVPHLQLGPLYWPPLRPSFLPDAVALLLASLPLVLYSAHGLRRLFKACCNSAALNINIVPCVLSNNGHRDIFGSTRMSHL